MKLLFIVFFLFTTACSTQSNNYSYDDDEFNESGEPSKKYLHRQELMRRTMKDRALLDAYERGARDTLEDQKGRLRAQRGFVYDAPIIEYITIPAGSANGAVYPSHKVPVILKKGRWVERNNVMLPDIKE